MGEIQSIEDAETKETPEPAAQRVLESPQSQCSTANPAAHTQVDMGGAAAMVTYLQSTQQLEDVLII